MKEENKKRINKLVIPFTKRTLSFLAATTVLVTGTVGCKEDNKKESEVTDTSSLISSTVEDEVVSSDLNITSDNSLESNVSEELSTDLNTNEEINTNNNSDNNSVNSNNKNNISSNNSTTTSSVQSTITSSIKNNQSVIINNSQNSSSVVSKPSVSVSSATSSVASSIPTQPVMPIKLTAENINDISKIDFFTETFTNNLYTVNGEALYTYICYRYNGVSYDCGRDELRFFVTLLNDNYINEETLTNMFSDKSLDDIKRYSMIMKCMSGITLEKNAFVHYDNFIVNNNKKQFLKDLELSSRSEENMLTFARSFYGGTNNYFNYGDDIVIDYYVYMFVSKAESFYNNSELHDMYINYINSYVNFKSYIEDFYTKSRAKILVK